MDCQKPMLEHKCGDKVLDLEMNSIGVTFRNLDDMMSQSSASNVWPQECKPLSSMGIDHVSKIDKLANATSGNGLPEIATSGNNSTTGNAQVTQAITTNEAHNTTTVLATINSSTTTKSPVKITPVSVSNNTLASISTNSSASIKVSANAVNGTTRLRSLRKN